MTKEKQTELPGINTPLADKIAKAVTIKQKMEELDLELDEAKQEVLEEMEKINKPEITAQGFKFTIKKTPEKKKLKISRAKL